MILAQSALEERDFIDGMSGVNSLFVAPEILNTSPNGEKADIWSVGQIIYCLMTGGVDPNRRGSLEESRDFREVIWYSCERHVREFV